MNPPTNAGTSLRRRGPLARFIGFAAPRRPWLWSLLLLLFGGIHGPSARAALQFDVFLGYDQIIPEACWFPVVCEINNDGLPFNGIIELTSDSSGQGHVRRVAVELPTGTLKRLVIPVFASTRGYSSWDVRLYDDRGKLRAEQTGQRPRKQIAVNHC